jgi:hypothetical protein
MKIKPGSAVLNHRALLKLFLIFFLTGILIGVKVALLEAGKHMTLLPFLPIYALAIPALIRGIRNEITNERAA